jgi:hypothetical protein
MCPHYHPWFLDPNCHCHKAGLRERPRRNDLCYRSIDGTLCPFDYIRTIGAVDMTPEERKQERELRDRARKRSARRADGITPRNQYLAANAKSRLKPWKAAGISRRTWYRRLKDGTGTSPSAMNLSEYCGHTCATQQAKPPRRNRISEDVSNPSA